MMDTPQIWRWIPTIILAVTGLFFLFVSYYTLYLGFKHKNDPDAYTPSGVPCTGGLCLIIAFLLSPCKWLAFLGLLDYGFWEIAYILFTELVIPAFKKKHE